MVELQASQGIGGEGVGGLGESAGTFKSHRVDRSISQPRRDLKMTPLAMPSPWRKPTAQVCTVTGPTPPHWEVRLPGWEGEWGLEPVF